RASNGRNAMFRQTRTYTFLRILAVLLLLQATMPRPSAQDEASHFRVNVVLVQLNVAVTDKNGNYVTGLRPDDFVITEDNIPEKIANFEEGDEWALRTPPPNQPGAVDATNAVAASNPAPTPEPAKAPDPPSDPSHMLAGTKLPGFGGANVFVLFDTSNYMYRGFVFAQDAI